MMGGSAGATMGKSALKSMIGGSGAGTGTVSGGLGKALGGKIAHGHQHPDHMKHMATAAGGMALQADLN